MVFQPWGEMMSPREMKQVDKRIGLRGKPRSKV